MILPVSTNTAYKGNALAPLLLGLYGLGLIISGGTHILFEDGGAGSVAGLLIKPAMQTIVAIFAWAGATQLIWGIIMLLVSLHYRSFTALMLFLFFVERSIITANAWVLKPAIFQIEGTMPPEIYVSFAVLIITPLAIYLAVKR